MLCGYIGKILFVEFSCGNIQEEALGEKTCLSLMTQAMIVFASLSPYFVNAMLVVIPSRIGKTKNTMPNSIWLIQLGILKS